MFTEVNMDEVLSQCSWHLEGLVCGRWSGNGGKKGRRETESEKWDVIDVEGIIQAIFIS